MLTAVRVLFSCFLLCFPFYWSFLYLVLASRLYSEYSSIWTGARGKSLLLAVMNRICILYYLLIYISILIYLNLLER